MSNTDLNELLSQLNLSDKKLINNYNNFINSIESGKNKFESAYSNKRCPHCNIYLTMDPNYQLYFAYDQNICQTYYLKLINE